MASYGASESVTAIRQVCVDLELAFAAWLEELLPIEEAAAETGLSPDHLRELCRQWRPASTRKPGRRVSIRRGDLVAHIHRIPPVPPARTSAPSKAVTDRERAISRDVLGLEA